MFINLFHSLRRHGVPVTFNEWLLLQKALSENLVDSSLTRFYYLARAILVKTEAHFDKYDQAFLECFGHIESSEDLLRTIEERLLRMPPLELTEEEKRMVEELNLEEVRARFLDQLRNQDDEPHVGGNKAIGVRGRSPYGAWGYNPAGVRIGQHESRMRSAIQIAEKRSFKNYRDDVTLDTRSIKTVLSYIRQVVREGPKDSLDVDGTIDATCRNAGELEFIWDRAKKKRIKLMLLMDAGGTMTPHTELVSRLVFGGQGYREGSAVLLLPQLHLPGTVHGHLADESRVHAKSPGSDQPELQSHSRRGCLYGSQRTAEPQRSDRLLVSQ